MTRKSDSHGSNARSAAALKSLRGQIDKLDLQILKLVNERASVAGEIGTLKKEEGGEVFNPAREEEVFQNVAQANKGPLDDATIRAIYREIMSGARALERIPKISCLGPEFSYSHLAAVERFGQAVEYTLGDVFASAATQDLRRDSVANPSQLACELRTGGDSPGL